MRTLVAIALSALIPVASALACLWDTETLFQERAVTPTVLETIVGKFLRHSQAYYQWRIDDRLEKLKGDPENDLLLDDLAVAYEKLGRHDEAIEVAKQQLMRNPKRYESLANLGTFLIHQGDLTEGLDYIESAIAVNPDAHFGREKYQVVLVKYVLSHSKDGEYELPLGHGPLISEDWDQRHPFNQFAAIELSGGKFTSLSETQRQEAIEGILGMMRFSRHDGPILLEVLGELLELERHKRQSFRCYISASEQARNETEKQAYEQLASSVIRYQFARGDLDSPIPAQPILERFKKEKAEADAWFADLKKREAAWIATGGDVDAKFSEYYRMPPVALVSDEAVEYQYSEYVYHGPNFPSVQTWGFFSGVCVVGIVGTLYVVLSNRIETPR